MLTEISFTLMVLCSACFIRPCYSTNTDNPTKDFYDDMQSRPILTYECYRNGTSIDPANSVNLTLLWDGTTTSNITGACGYIWSATSGTEDSYAVSLLTTDYDTARGVGILSTESVTEDIIVLNKFDGKGLFLKIDIHGGDAVYKIYDVDFKCENADQILATACPNGCNMMKTREVFS